MPVFLSGGTESPENFKGGCGLRILEDSGIPDSRDSDFGFRQDTTQVGKFKIMASLAYRKLSKHGLGYTRS